MKVATLVLLYGVTFPFFLLGILYRASKESFMSGYDMVDGIIHSSRYRP